MRIHTKITVTRKGDLGKRIDEIKDAIDSDHDAVKVGLPAGKAPTDVLQIGVWNHFGTAGGASGGGWGGPVPARPFLTAAVFKGRDGIRAQLREIAMGVLTKGEPIDGGLQKLGIYATGLVQDQIASSMPPPNSPVTVSRKGSGGTLIDTGRLRQSITWKLD